MKSRLFTIPAALAGERIDVALAKLEPTISRAQWQKAIRSGAVKINDIAVAGSYRVQEADRVDYRPVTQNGQMQHKAQPVPILYQDDDLIVIDKPAGLVVYPPAGSRQPSVVASLKQLINDSGERAGVVHRLDKDTSGVMVLARQPLAKSFLINQFKTRHVHKTYLALVTGHLHHAAARIELPLQRTRRNWRSVEVSVHGKPAVLEYETVREYKTSTLVRVKLLTGRTHQIRVQFSYLGHPVVGDRVYGARQQPAALPRQFLHAAKLSLQLPSGRRRSFSAVLPPDLQQYLKQLQ